MKLPEATRLIKLRHTNVDIPRGTYLFQGLPRIGKTTLAAYLCEALVGKDNTFFIDFPEEEGTSSISDLNIPYTTVATQPELDEVFNILVKAQPKAIIWDGLLAFWNARFVEAFPSGSMPEDHGKSWSNMYKKIRSEIVRFKMIPSVEQFIATSLIWKDDDDFSGAKGRWQVVLPGQLKVNIYGLFSYNVLLKVVEMSGKEVRIAELQPTATTVAGVRAPLSANIPKSVAYDLKSKEGVGPILKALGLKAKEEGN